MVEKTELETYYKNHSNGETAAHFGVSETTILRWLTAYGIQRKVGRIKPHQPVQEFLNNFYATFSKEEFIEDFKHYTQPALCTKYGLLTHQIRHLKEDLGLQDRMRSIDNIVIEDVNQFYNFYKTHTDLETVREYSLGNSPALYKILQKYNLERKPRIEPFAKLVARIDKVELEEYYNTHSLAECEEHFNTGNLRKLLRSYGLLKTKEHESFEEVVARIDKDAFLDLYNNGKYEELQKTYNVSYTMVRKLKEHFNVSNKTIDCLSFSKTIDLVSLKADLENCNLSRQFIIDKYKIPTEPCFDGLCRLLGVKNATVGSNFELEVREFIESIYDKQIQSHVRSIPELENKEIDLYIPELKLGFELNGTYWHSIVNHPDRQYHLKKSKAAEKAGIHLVHIWEYEWENPTKQNIIKTYLLLLFNKIPNKIYARNCTIKKISNKEAKIFNDQNHLQGHRNAQLTYGLFYNDTLVQLMSFSKTRYNKNLKDDNSWEIIRGCPGSNNLVVGGVSKLFTTFVREITPTAVFSYCDFNKFDGKSYLALGMKFVGYTGPDLKYVTSSNKVINRNPRKYKQNMSTAVCLLYGAGSKKFIWSNK